MNMLLNNQSSENTDRKFIKLAGIIILPLSALVFSSIASGIGFFLGGPVGAAIMWVFGFAGGVFIGYKISNYLSNKI
jgi:hypothetical protein